MLYVIRSRKIRVTILAKSELKVFPTFTVTVEEDTNKHKHQDLHIDPLSMQTQTTRVPEFTIIYTYSA